MQRPLVLWVFVLLMDLACGQARPGHSWYIGPEELERFSRMTLVQLNDTLVFMGYVQEPIQQQAQPAGPLVRVYSGRYEQFHHKLILTKNHPPEPCSYIMETELNDWGIGWERGYGRVGYTALETSPSKDKNSSAIKRYKKGDQQLRVSSFVQDSVKTWRLELRFPLASRSK